MPDRPAQRGFSVAEIAHHEAGHAIFFETRPLTPGRHNPWETIRLPVEGAVYGGGLKSKRNFQLARDELLQAIGGLAAEALCRFPSASNESIAITVVDSWLPDDASNDVGDVETWASDEACMNSFVSIAAMTPEFRTFLLEACTDAARVVLENRVRWLRLAEHCLDLRQQSAQGSVTLDWPSSLR